MNFRAGLGLLGSLALIFGVFSPVLSAPLVESITYYRNGNEFGVAVLIIAGVALIATFSRAYRALPFLGLAALGVIGYTFFTTQRKFNDVRSRVADGISDGAARDFVNSAIDSVQMQWGWGVLAVGATLLIATAMGNRADA